MPFRRVEHPYKYSERHIVRYLYGDQSQKKILKTYKQHLQAKKKLALIIDNIVIYLKSGGEKAQGKTTLKENVSNNDDAITSLKARPHEAFFVSVSANTV